MLTIDHIVLSSTDLARDAAALEERLGVPLSEGGKHALFGTHNKLLRLGDLYMELIAICLLYTSPSPRDLSTSRMPSSA